MRKPSMLLKIMEWKQLTDELAAHFKTDAERLPTLVQTVLEVASEGQTRGMRQAKAVDGTTKKIGRPSKEEQAAAKAAQKALPHLSVRMASMFQPGEVLHLSEILSRLRKQGLMPKSKNPSGYLGLVLGQHPKMFARVKGKKRGMYRLKEAAQESTRSPKHLNGSNGAAHPSA